MHYAPDAFGTGTPDQQIALVANASDFIVLTADDDFKGMIRQVRKGTRKRLREQAGRIQLLVGGAHEVTRLRNSMDWIEAQYVFFQQRNQRLLATITTTELRSQDVDAPHFHP